MAELNLLDPDFLADPYPAYHRLRTEDPVHRHPLGFYVLTRYDDVAALLRDARFGKGGYQALIQSRFGTGPNGPWLALSMLFRDPPDHTRLGALVSKAFTPRVVETLRDHIQGIMDRLLAGVVGSPRMDYCLGAPLARFEAQVAIGSVLRRFPALSLGVEYPTWRPSSTLRGLQALPVVLGSTRG